MTTELDGAVLEWVATWLGRRAHVVGTTKLKPYGCTWAVDAEIGDSVTRFVLKTGSSVDWGDSYTTEAEALVIARAHDLPVSKVLGAELHATGDDPVALLMTWIEGSATVPLEPSVERLYAVGRLAASLHAIPLEPSPTLPLRKHHTPWTDFALWRRLAKGTVDDAMAELGWNRAATEELLRTTDSSPFLDEADQRIQAMEVPDGPTTFVHGDLWQGNTLWNGDRLVGVIDWEAAGTGHSGVDLSCLRWDAALLFGADAPDHITAGWTEVTGREPDAQSYWDVVTALNLPVDVGRIAPTLREAGRADLDAETITDRHYAFLRDAMDRLDR